VHVQIGGVAQAFGGDLCLGCNNDASRLYTFSYFVCFRGPMVRNEFMRSRRCVDVVDWEMHCFKHDNNFVRRRWQFFRELQGIHFLRALENLSSSGLIKFFNSDDDLMFIVFCSTKAARVHHFTISAIELTFILSCPIMQTQNWHSKAQAYIDYPCY